MKPKKIYRPELVKAVDAILSMPSGPKRWRASVALYLNLNPVDESGYSAKQVYRKIATDNVQTRQMQDNKFAGMESIDDSLRLGLSAPSWFMGIVEAFDKEAFDNSNPDARKNFHRLLKEFPELRIAEKS